jgi:hypothetical protein
MRAAARLPCTQLFQMGTLKLHLTRNRQRVIPGFLTAVADFATGRSSFSFLLGLLSVRHLSSVHNCDIVITLSKYRESELSWLDPLASRVFSNSTPHSSIFARFSTFRHQL